MVTESIVTQPLTVFTASRMYIPEVSTEKYTGIFWLPDIGDPSSLFHSQE